MSSDDHFINVDRAMILADEDSPAYPACIETAAALVERERERWHCDGWMLLDLPYLITSPRMLRALDILVLRGFISRPDGGEAT